MENNLVFLEGIQFIGKIAYNCVQKNIYKLKISDISEIYHKACNQLKKENIIIYYSPRNIRDIVEKHPTLFKVDDNYLKLNLDKKNKFYIYFRAGMSKNLSEKLDFYINEAINEEK